MTDRVRAAVHTGAFYAAMFGALGAHLPFWPVWMEDWGLSPGEVGLYLSLGVVGRIFAGLGFPILADRLDRRRMTVVVLSLLGAAVFAAHLAIGSKAILLAATIFTGMMISAIMPLGEALGARAAQRFGFPYAYPRAVGSVAFLVASLAVGLLAARFGPDAILWWIVVFLILLALASRGHPGGGTGAGSPPPALAEILRMLAQPTFALFSIAAGFCLSSHAVYYAYGSVHWRSLGLAEDLIGALWAFSVAVEVAFMLVLGPVLIRRVGPVGAIALSGLGGILRWGAMMLDPLGAWLWVLQTGHTLTFVAGHLGAIAFISAAIPDRYGATAQGAFMGLTGGILTAAGMGLGALLYDGWGGLTYGVAAAMSAIGLGLSIWLGRRWKGQVLAV